MGEAVKIIVENTKVRETAGTSKKTGKDFLIREQRALLHGDRIRGEVRLMLEQEQEPYPPGEYEIDLERSVYIGSYQSLRFNPVLVAATKTHTGPSAVSGPRMPSAA